MRFVYILLPPAAFLAAFCVAGAQAPPAAPNSSAASAAETERPRVVTGYSLPPARAAMATAYARSRRALYFVRFVFGLVVLWLLLRLGIAARFRDWAEGLARRRFLQAALFAPALLAAIALLDLPGAAARHWLSVRYGQSIQGWGSWVWDWTKGGMLNVLVGMVLVWLLYAVMRRSPRRWWFYVWTTVVPLLVFAVFISPLVVEPLFFQFRPLAAAEPELAAQIERVTAHAGLQIPESRMYIMNASTKLTAVNAYVSGLGASRRVVVWDTALAQLSPPEILAVFGHELGHYELGHVARGVAFAAGLILLFLFLGSRLFHRMVNRFGGAWGLRGPADWASLPVMLLLLSVFSFLFAPLGNAYSRHIEHQADQYGLEVTHGIVPDAGTASASSLQKLGEIALAEPDPSWLVKIWFYDHPPLDERIRFALSYDPWARGEPPRFVR